MSIPPYVPDWGGGGGGGGGGAHLPLIGALHSVLFRYVGDDVAKTDRSTNFSAPHIIGVDRFQTVANS